MPNTSACERSQTGRRPLRRREPRRGCPCRQDRGGGAEGAPARADRAERRDRGLLRRGRGGGAAGVDVGRSGDGIAQRAYVAGRGTRHDASRARRSPVRGSWTGWRSRGAMRPRGRCGRGGGGAGSCRRQRRNLLAGYADRSRRVARHARGTGWIDPRNGLACSVVRAFRRFTVRPVLPEPLGALSVLAGNLRWSWHPPTQDVFASIDPGLWRDVAGDPVRFLGAVGRERLDELVDDGDFRARLDAAHADLQRYLSEDRWYARKAGDDAPARDRATSRPSSASPRCCPSTPAASASSPATTSRRPPTSASRWSAWACSTATATSSRRSTATAGSRRATRSSTPTSCP